MLLFDGAKSQKTHPVMEKLFQKVEVLGTHQAKPNV